MLKYLYPRIDWDEILIVGFDLDGTLYDEADFIAQVYRPISGLLADACRAEREPVYRWMLRRWLEKGSSYDRIFQEVLELHGFGGSAARGAVDGCLALFRGFKPQLQPSVRVTTILDAMKERFALFLVSDGSARLQAEKWQALGIDRWIDRENIAISGEHGHGYAKPSTAIVDKVAVLRSGPPPGSVVYFGDRDVDRDFAERAGFRFVRVKGLVPVTP